MPSDQEISRERGTKVDKPIKGELWKHYKGGLYRILEVGTYESTMEPVVIYESLKDGSVWVRPTHIFLSTVDENGYVPRFSRADCG